MEDRLFMENGVLVKPLIQGGNESGGGKSQSNLILPDDWVFEDFPLPSDQASQHLALPANHRERIVLAMFLLVCFPFVGSTFLALPRILGFCLMIAVIGPFCLRRACNRNYGRHQSAENFLEFKKKLYGENSRQYGLGLYRLGLLHQKTGDYDSALECYRRVASFPSLAVDASGAIIHRRIGKLQYSMGYYQDALESFETALELRRLHPKPYTIRIQEDIHCIAQTHEKMANFGRAVRTYQEALDTMKRQGYEKNMDIIQTHLRMSSAYRSMGNFEESVKSLFSSLQVCIYNEGDPPSSILVARLYERISDILLEHGETTRALEQLKLSKEVYIRGGKTEEDRQVRTISEKIDDIESNATNV